MHRRPALALILAAGLLLGATAGHAQAPDVAFDAQPAAGSSTDPSGGWFSLSLPAGDRAEQSVAVRNTSSEPVELAAGAVDATTMAAGGASYAAPDAPAEITAGWIELATSRIRLAPGEQRAIPFVVRVPSDARPGDHLAGISIAAPSKAGQTSTTANGTTTSIDLRTRRVIAVHVTVPGPAQAQIEVRGVEAAIRPPGPQLEIALANTGQRLTRGRGVLTLLDDGVTLEFDLDTFVPATSIAYPLPWPDLTAGTHAVRVELEHEGAPVRWEGDVTVADDAVQAAVDAASPRTPTAAGPIPSSGMSPVVIGVAVLGGVAVAAGGQAGLRLLRRRAA